MKNTRDVERELTAVLHRHAEDAMRRTNTLAEHRKLQSVVADQPQTDPRRRWVVGGVAAAAVAAAVVGVGVWSADPSEDPSSPPVAQAPDSTGAADIAAAEGLAAAFANHDAAAAASHLALGREEAWFESDAAWKRDAAYSVEYLMKPCTETGSTSVGTVFTCPYAMHVLGSREVGKGPFRHNILHVTVTDGKVTSADSTIPFETNGVQQHLESVRAWLVENHPKDVPFLMKEEQDVKPTEWPRWTQLWQQYTREYIAATNRAG